MPHNLCHIGTEPQNILVTGGAGFIGSHLVQRLLKSKSNTIVTIFDKLTYASDQSILRDFLSTGRVKFIEGDVCNITDVKNAMSGNTMVFHLAAETHVPNSFLNPELFFQTNTMGTQCVLNVALNGKVKRFIHISTDEVYGATQQFVKEDFGFHPSTPYANSKVEAEKAVFHARTRGLDAIIIRPTNAIGLRQHQEKLLPRFINMALEGKPLTIEGSGKQERCFIPASDLVTAILVVAEKSNPMETYNIAGKEIFTVLEVAKIVSSLTMQNIGIRFVTDRKTNDSSYRISGEKVENLGYEQESNIQFEIEKLMFQWLSKRRLTPDNTDSTINQNTARRA